MDFQHTPAPRNFLKAYVKLLSQQQSDFKQHNVTWDEEVEQEEEEDDDDWHLHDKRDVSDPIMLSHSLLLVADVLWVYISCRNWSLGRKPKDKLLPHALSRFESIAVIGFLFLSLLFSWRYHSCREKKGYKADVWLAFINFIIQFYILPKTSIWPKIAAIVVCICSLIVYFFARYDYEKLHGIWHWMVGVGAIIVALNYL